MQAIATLVLVIITGFYAWVTHQMMLDAERDRVEASRPVVTFNLSRDAVINLTRFCVDVENVGLGPALDLRLKAEGRLRYLLIESERTQRLPFTLATGGPVGFCFLLDLRGPLNDEKETLRWPRDDVEAELDVLLGPVDQTLAPSVRSAQDPLHNASVTRAKLLREYRQAVIKTVRDIIDPFILEATYLDVHGKEWETAVPVIASHLHFDQASPYNANALTHSRLSLGVTSLAGPDRGTTPSGSLRAGAHLIGLGKER